MSDLTLVCCWVGGRQYAFNDTDVRQIARVEKMRVETAADGRAGVLDVGGQPVPVFRLGSVLARGTSRAAPSGGHHIAVTGERREQVGWLVDRIARTTLPHDAHIGSLPAIVGPVAANWFESLVRISGTSVLLMSPRALNPAAQRRTRPESATSAAGVRRKGGDPAERVVLLFSTPALPSAGAARRRRQLVAQRRGPGDRFSRIRRSRRCDGATAIRDRAVRSAPWKHADRVPGRRGDRDASSGRQRSACGDRHLSAVRERHVRNRGGSRGVARFGCTARAGTVRRGGRSRRGHVGLTSVVCYRM